MDEIRSPTSNGRSLTIIPTSKQSRFYHYFYALKLGINCDHYFFIRSGKDNNVIEIREIFVISHTVS